MRYNTLAPWRTTSTIHTNGNYHYFSIWLPSFVTGHALAHFVDKTHVLVVTVDLIWLLFLKIIFFNFVTTPRKFLKFTRFIRSYVNHPAVVLTNHCQSYTACLMRAVQSCHVPFFCSCLSPMIMHLHCWAHLLLECCEL